MPWYHDSTNDASITRPDFIRLADMTVVAGEELTDSVLLDNGWEFREYEPVPEPLILSR